MSSAWLGRRYGSRTSGRGKMWPLLDQRSTSGPAALAAVGHTAVSSPQEPTYFSPMPNYMYMLYLTMCRVGRRGGPRNAAGSGRAAAAAAVREFRPCICSSGQHGGLVAGALDSRAGSGRSRNKVRCQVQQVVARSGRFFGWVGGGTLPPDRVELTSACSTVQ
jgi:hypothetical protein